MRSLFLGWATIVKPSPQARARGSEWVSGEESGRQGGGSESENEQPDSAATALLFLTQPNRCVLCGCVCVCVCFGEGWKRVGPATFICSWVAAVLVHVSVFLGFFYVCLWLTFYCDSWSLRESGDSVSGARGWGVLTVRKKKVSPRKGDSQISFTVIGWLERWNEIGDISNWNKSERNTNVYGKWNEREWNIKIIYKLTLIKRKGWIKNGVEHSTKLNNWNTVYKISLFALNLERIGKVHRRRLG